MKRSLGPTTAQKSDLTPEEVEEFKANPYPEDVDRPKTRGDCWDFENDRPIGTRPCPFVTCRYNNFLNVTEHGTIILAHPGMSPEEVPSGDSCALDVAERDYMSEPDLGKIMGVSFQAVQQQIYKAQESARRIRKRMLKVIQ